MTPRHHLNAPGSFLRTSFFCFAIFHDFDEIVPGCHGFPASWGDGVYTIGKNVKNHDNTKAGLLI